MEKKLFLGPRILREWEKIKSHHTMPHLNYFSFMCGIVWVPYEVIFFKNLFPNGIFCIYTLSDLL